MKKNPSDIRKAAVAGAVILVLAGMTAFPKGLAARKPGTVGSREGTFPQEVRIKKFPIAVQCWTFRKFSFFEALERIKDLGVVYVQAYPGQLLEKGHPELRFDHNLPDAQVERVKAKLEELGLSLVSYGVVHFENTEESMNRVFGFARKLGIRTIVTEPRYDDYTLLEKMARKYNLRVAVHNHPLPSKYARPETVLYHVDGRDPRIGACADTGHWMRTGVRPVEALRALKGRVLDVHLKDLNAFGDKNAHDVPFGQGKAGIRDILEELTLQDYPGMLVIEHERKEDADNPSPAIRKGLDYIRRITYYQDYEPLLKRGFWGYTKHGWNHYGPGYFELDEKTGVLKSQGGMGLLWYARKRFRDFILELDFRCADKMTNSGVFLRVPEMPVSDDYIYHAFEIQIYDAGKGIHRTGAVYDAEPPAQEASRPAGEWNHLKIAFIRSHITVELNAVKVVDWEAEPRGKVKDFAREGYMGLQNHDSRSPVYFRNVYVKEVER
ncbi:MAG: family 16 glycoside hydrolase [Candidatus Aminicenantales bacterium]